MVLRLPLIPGCNDDPREPGGHRRLRRPPGRTAHPGDALPCPGRGEVPCTGPGLPPRRPGPPRSGKRGWGQASARTVRRELSVTLLRPGKNPPEHPMIHTKAYAAPAAAQPLGPHEIDRRDVGPDDVLLDIAFCGVCHSDLHQVRDEWGQAAFPMVPGHEIVGRVAQVGAAGEGLQARRPGRSWLHGRFLPHLPRAAPEDQEQFCEKGAACTYNSTEMDRVTRTYGGYSSRIVVDRGLRAAHPAPPGPGRRRAPAVRRHHHLLAPAPLARRRGTPGGRGGPGRPGPHGGEAGRGHGRGGDHAQHLRRQGGRRPASGRGRLRPDLGPGHLQAPGRALRPDPRHRLRAPRPTTRTWAWCAWTAPWSCWGSPRRPPRWPPWP